MNPTVYIETERLFLRDWTREDRITFAKMNCNPNVMKYFPNMLSRNESDDFVERIENELKEYSYGLFAVEIKASGNFIGYVGFHRFNLLSPAISGWEIGWRLSDEYWGNGYATEAAGACLTFARNNHLFPCIYSFTSVVNTPSENVMKRIGMEYAGTFQHPSIDDGNILKKHLLYKIIL